MEFLSCDLAGDAEILLVGVRIDDEIDERALLGSLGLPADVRRHGHILSVGGGNEAESQSEDEERAHIQ